MYKDEWHNHINIYNMKSPIISKEAKLIITSFDSKKYYDDGYSFYRSKIEEITQIPANLSIKIPREYALIVNKSIYFSCSFEYKLDELDHRYFDENHLSISTYANPIIQNQLVNEVFLNNLKLYNLNRNKHELIQFQSSIYTKTNFEKPTMLILWTLLSFIIIF